MTIITELVGWCSLKGYLRSIRLALSNEVNGKYIIIMIQESTKPTFGTKDSEFVKKPLTQFNIFQPNRLPLI